MRNWTGTINSNTPIALLGQTVFATAILAFAINPVHADDKTFTGNTGAPVAQQRVGLEEVVVTAQKRRQPMQSLATAVSALTGDDIDRSRIKDVMDLGLYVPNLVVSNNGTAGRMYIRGVGNNLDFLGAQSAVALHLDGVYQSRSWGVFYDFIDVERIEVLRGPQGTIYGRNASGGAINVISMKPTEELTARATASVGNYDALNFSGTISSALRDDLEGRLTVVHKSRDGYADNLYPGSRDLDDDQLRMVRGELRASPNDDLEIRLIGNHLIRDAQGPAVVPSTDGFAASLGARSNTDPFEVSHNVDTFYDAQNSGVTAIATWTVRDHLILESITAYTENSISSNLDSDGTELDVVSFRNDEDHRQHSQELRLLGNPGSSGFEWQAGLYYLREDTTDAGIVLIPVSNASIPVSAGIEVDAFAAYLQGTYPVGDRWGITAGLRYNTETKKLSRLPALKDQATWNDWTPHISLEYHAGERLFAYASVTKGFKSGGYNALGTGEVVGPENVWSYEIGSKSELLDRRLRVNSAAFYARYEDQQVNTFLGPGLARIDNAAESTIRGVELEILAALARKLDIGVTLSYLDAKFDRYIAADPFLGGVDLAGSRMSNAPKYSFSVVADYTIPIGQQSGITAHADYLWQDDVKYDVFDDLTTTQKSYCILNASIFYSGANQRWKVGIWANNLTDKVYFTSHAKLNFSPSGVISWTGKPRTYGMEFSWIY